MSVLSPIIWARSMWRRLWLPSFTRSRLHGGSEKHRHPPYERGDRTLTAWYCLPSWQLSLESDTCQRRSRASSLMPLTSRYLRKINRTRSASSSTTTSLPFLSRGAGDRPPRVFSAVRIRLIGEHRASGKEILSCQPACHRTRRRLLGQTVDAFGLRKSGDRKFTDISPVVLAQAGAYPAGQPHSGDIQ